MRACRAFLASLLTSIVFSVGEHYAFPTESMFALSLAGHLSPSCLFFHIAGPSQDASDGANGVTEPLEKAFFLKGEKNTFPHHSSLERGAQKSKIKKRINKRKDNGILVR